MLKPLKRTNPKSVLSRGLNLDNVKIKYLGLKVSVSMSKLQECSDVEVEVRTLTFQERKRINLLEYSISPGEQEFLGLHSP